MRYYIGLDVSKGYTDVSIINEAGSVIHEGQYDDTHLGHSALLKVVTGLKAASSLEIGMESTGGFERNWLKFMRGVEHLVDYESKAYLLNPLTIRRFSQISLHQSTTDKSAAKLIANYLKAGLPRTAFNESEQLDDGIKALYRTTLNLIGRKAQVSNELQSLLPSVQPELLMYCQQGMTSWVLELLAKYPTVDKLARARVSSLVKINQITQAKAEKIIESAKNSVASNTSEATALAVQVLVDEHKSLNDRISSLQVSLQQTLAKNSLIKRLCTIPGIGLWTAIGLLVEIGDFTRFARSEQLVAYAGLDPVYRQSGDGVKNCRISKKGNPNIRRLLFLPAQTASIHNPVIKAYYNRLRSGGKSYYQAMTACMRKLLTISFAILVSEKDFDPDYENNRKAPSEDSKVAIQPVGKTKGATDLTAPVSRREAVRRKRQLEENKKACTKPEGGQRLKKVGKAQAPRELLQNI